MSHTRITVLTRSVIKRTSNGILYYYSSSSNILLLVHTRYARARIILSRPSIMVRNIIIITILPSPSKGHERSCLLEWLTPIIKFAFGTSVNSVQKYLLLHWFAYSRNVQIRDFRALRNHKMCSWKHVNMCWKCLNMSILYLRVLFYDTFQNILLMSFITRIFCKKNVPLIIYIKSYQTYSHNNIQFI